MLRIRPSPDRKHGVIPWALGLISLFFPGRCPLCRTWLPDPINEGGICPLCHKDLSLVTPPFCPQCGRPYPPGTSSHYCADCLEGKPFYQQARSIFLYRGILAEAVQRFKYGGDIHLAQPLGRFWDLGQWKGKGFDFLVPVPLHPSRLRERGFNQALLLGKVIAAKEGIKVLPRILRRIRRTRPQVELGLKERQENVRGAFAVREPAIIQGKSILLVDDVLTTGATVNECAKVLKKAGAEEVWVWTLARAV